MALFGNNQTVTTTFAGKDMLTPVVRGISNTMDRFKRDAATGFGLAAGINVFNMATRAVGAVVDVLGDAVTAAIEDERSIGKLNTALDANVDGWRANTDAIDEAIDARMKLGFEDTELRESMGRLVTRTHDVTKALDLQKLAMDLARARNMDLASASDLVGKAYSGQVGALRRAGLAIDKNADSTKALAQLQQAFGGQAKSFADSTEGTMRVLQVQFGEVIEKLGYELLPHLKNLADLALGAVEALGGLGDAFHNIQRFISPHDALIEDSIKVLKDRAEALGLDGMAVQEWVQSQIDAKNAQLELNKAISEDPLIQSLDEQIRSMSEYGGVAGQMLLDERALEAQFADNADKVKELQDAYNAQVQSVKDARRAQVLLITSQSDLMKQQQASSEAVKLGEEQLERMTRAQAYLAKVTVGSGIAIDEATDGIVDDVTQTSRAVARELGPSLRNRLKSNRDEIDQVMADLKFSLTHPMQLAKQRNRITTLLMGEDIRKAMASKRPEIRAEAMRVRMIFINMLRGLPGYAQNIVDQMNVALASIDMIPGFGGISDIVNDTAPHVPKNWENWSPRRRRRWRHRHGRAGGGPVEAGGIYTVGESGPETLVMGSQGGRVIPNGGGDINLYVDGEKLFRWMMRRQGREALLSPAG